MKQIVLIFRKDLRRFWPEILFCWFALLLLCRYYPRVWLPRSADDNPFAGIPYIAGLQDAIPGFMVSLVAISWLVLIGRVIQDETLLGHRQYWVTRPIDWGKLLAEKLLFILLFALVPFILATAMLLHEASLPVSQNIAGLLANAALCFFAFLLPIITLATLTKNFFRLSLTIVAIFAGIIGVVAILSDRIPSIFTPYNDFLSLPLFVLSCALAILTQYSSRTVWLARAFLSVSLAITLLVAINPLESWMLESVYYPAHRAAVIPVDLTYSSDASRVISVTRDDERKSDLTVPLDVANVPFGIVVRPEDVRVRIDAPDGTHWQSGWQAVYNHTYRNATKMGTITIKVQNSYLDRVRDKPLSIHLQLALTQLEEGRSQSIVVPAATSFTVPGLGVCEKDRQLSRNPGFTCRWALRQATSFDLYAPWTTGPCSESVENNGETVELRSTVGSANPDLYNPGITSVWVTAASFSYSAATDAAITGDLPPVRVCPGATLVSTSLQVVRRERIVINTPQLLLPPRTKNSSPVIGIQPSGN